MSREPFAHKVISASAGSGKTHQLTNRYLALLAAGVEPDAILATTFTRKAAGEILDRVLERLAKAAVDAADAKELAEQTGADQAAPAAFAALLRRLLRNLHRVRISTLDSFYIALAGSLSLELGLPAGWSICETPDDELLRRDALERLLDRQPEDIGRLLPLLSKGETNRSVHRGLMEVIQAHHACYRGSPCNAWERLHVPEQVAAAEREAALERLRSFDFSACRNKRFFDARDKDVANFEANNWPAFLGTGLGARLLTGETTYCGKPIPDEAQSIYKTLGRHATSQVLFKLREQTRATWDLLHRFHEELWALKQTSGSLRFDEVTQALADRPQARAWPAKMLAFRLDGAIEHLLLDEFQDTSLAQWLVLQPLASDITKAKARRSFFCVGDVKQAIYGWRGGMAEILNTLPASLGALQERTLVESRRSAQPVIDAVNQVFGNLHQFPAGGKNQGGLSAWVNRFQPHTTFKKDSPGYVCLHRGPAQEEGQNAADARRKHFTFVAEMIEELTSNVPDGSMGVLCRKNESVARMIYELRKSKVEASEEGGNALTDSPAVEVLLSLFTLADHPGHSIAWFHLQHSPLQDRIPSSANADAFARRLRGDLLEQGYGRFTHTWAMRLASACDRRDLWRLQQLIEMAYAFQPRSTLRAGDFVAWVQQQRVLDPSGARVRVMTMHAAKGLEFDCVVLPELDAGLAGRSPAFVVRRDPRSLEVNFVCRYADETVQQLLTDDERLAFEQDRQQRVEESLSLLYVAMTRAIHALYLYIPGDRKPDKKDAWHNLLKHALAPGANHPAKAILYEQGDASWFKRLEKQASPPDAQSAERRKPILFRPTETGRRRGLEHVAPSRREGGA
ncbi:MAG TPA: UvrD-helicase domain-containing protein, partial [Gemmataceae bacterium]